MAADEDAEASTGAAIGLLVELEHDRGEGDDVVARHHALGLVAKDLLEVGAAAGTKAERDPGRPAEPGVVVGEEALAQVAIGAGEGVDAGHPQLVHEAILQRAIDALPAAPRLGREAQDVLDAEAGQGAAELRAPGAVGGSAGGGGVHRPVRPVRVEGARQPIPPRTCRNAIMMAAVLSPPSSNSACSRCLVASSTMASNVCRCAGTRASQGWRLPSRCSSSPKHGRGSRRRRCRPRARRLGNRPACWRAVLTKV